MLADRSSKPHYAQQLAGTCQAAHSWLRSTGSKKACLSKCPLTATGARHGGGCCWRCFSNVTAVLGPEQCPHWFVTATTLCFDHPVTCTQLHSRLFAPHSYKPTWQQGFCVARSLGSCLLVRALYVRTSAGQGSQLGSCTGPGSQTGKCSPLQASAEPGGVPHQLQATESELENEGQNLLPANGTAPAVPQRMWYRDRQILLCLAGTGLITLVSFRLEWPRLVHECSALGPHHRPPAGLQWKQNACSSPVQGVSLCLIGVGPWGVVSG